jgi:hypothetical protein
MNWRIWYNTGQIVDGSTAEDWANAPNEGVLGIAIHFGRRDDGVMLGELFSGSDWYWMYEGKIYQSGTSSEIPNEWLEHSAPSGSVLKKGKWTTEEHIDQVSLDMVDWVQ